jgi:hypothetical protein
LLEPAHLKHGRRQKVILNVAVSRLWTACHHDDPGGSSYFDDNVITWFIAVVASGLNTLREMKYLTDPESALPRDRKINLEKALKQNATILLQPLATSDAQAGRDFCSNTVFGSGLFYPSGSPQLPNIRYAWNSSVKYWTRVQGSIGPHWDVVESKARDCSHQPLDTCCQHFADNTCPEVDDSVSNVHALCIYADDVSTLIADTYSNASAFLHMSDISSNVVIAICRILHRSRAVSVEAAVVISHLTRRYMGQEYPFSVSSLEFYFDRFLTENIGDATVYTSWEFFLDIIYSVSLFTGLSFYTVSFRGLAIPPELVMCSR